MSSNAEACQVRLQGAVDPLNNVTLDTLQDFLIGHALGVAALSIGAGGGAITEADHDGQAERPVGLTVPAWVQPVSAHLPREVDSFLTDIHHGRRAPGKDV